MDREGDYYWFWLTERNLPPSDSQKETHGREVQAMVYSFIQNVFIETEMIEQEKMRSGKMSLGTGWSPDLVVTAWSSPWPLTPAKEAKTQQQRGDGVGNSPLSSPSLLA